VRPFGPQLSRHAGLIGFELIHDPFDGLVGSAAQIGGGSVGPELLIGRSDVHAVLRRLQWNSPVVATIGWRLHRHHRGPQFLIDTTNTGWGLFHGHGHLWPGISAQISPDRTTKHQLKPLQLLKNAKREPSQV
jgi:hypothetical protein